MYLSGVHNNQPLVHGIVGHEGGMVVHDGGLGVSSSASMAGGSMLIDTGAQISVLDLDFALRLGLPETDTASAIVGVAGEDQARQFTGLLHLPEWNITVPTTFASLPILERLGMVALIGMDVLIEFILTLDGPNRTLTLSLPNEPQSA